MTDLTHTPDWAKNAIFYHIFPDRFAKSDKLEKPTHIEAWDAPMSRHGFKGGQGKVVHSFVKLLQDLGVNAIYFTPIFMSTANHRYHTFDYFQVDPILGGNKVFSQLLEEAHRRDIKIILDGVFNHASRGFFQFNHILENSENSPYLDWFKVYGYPMNAYQGKPNYSCWWNLPDLPQFNTDNPQVRAFLFEVARYWIDAGVDGWRLDVPFEIKDETFWRQFRAATKLPNSEAYLVGEIPSEAQEWLKGDMFDGVMNYQFTAACIGFFGATTRDEAMIAGMMGLPEVPSLDAKGFAERTKALLEIYPRQNVLAQLNLMDSHDMPRFLSMVSGKKAAFRLATLFQMTYPGAPCIYYGNEIGMAGGRDPENRAPFPWDESRWDHDLLKSFKTFIQIRHMHPVLRTGEYVPVYAEGQHLVILRHLNGEKMLLAFNAGDHPWDMNVEVQGHVDNDTRFKDLIHGGEAVIRDGYLRNYILPAWEGVVFNPQP